MNESWRSVENSYSYKSKTNTIKDSCRSLQKRFRAKTWMENEITVNLYQRN